MTQGSSVCESGLLLVPAVACPQRLEHLGSLQIPKSLQYSRKRSIGGARKNRRDTRSRSSSRNRPLSLERLAARVTLSLSQNSTDMYKLPTLAVAELGARRRPCDPTIVPGCAFRSRLVSWSFPVRFGLWTVQTMRTCLVAFQSTLDRPRPDTCLTHSQN